MKTTTDIPETKILSDHLVFCDAVIDAYIDGKITKGKMNKKCKLLSKYVKEYPTGHGGSFHDNIVREVFGDIDGYGPEFLIKYRLSRVRKA